MRSVVPLAVLCLGCVAGSSRPTPTPFPVVADDPPEEPLDAMLLPPVEGQLALWINQPANFAVVGETPDRHTDILYQQTALDAVPASGYVYIPRHLDAAKGIAEPDAGYSRIYLLASLDPIDQQQEHGQVVDGYAVEAVADTICDHGRLLVFEDGRLVRDIGVCPDPSVNRQHRIVESRRAFFVLSRTVPKPKSIPLPKPPTVHPKPGGPLSRSDERMLRWLAAKDQWYAITHDGEPGTELVRALGYVRVGDHWELGRANPALAAAHAQVRDILNGSIGTLHGPASALVMERTGHVTEVITSTWATPSADRWLTPGDRVSAIAAIESRGDWRGAGVEVRSASEGGSRRSSGGSGYETGRSSVRYESTPVSAPASSHESSRSYSAPSAPSAPASGSSGGGHRP